MAAETNRGVPLSTLCPKFLHTNSTSHTWPFSAIAELIDNAYDPDVCAKQFWIDKTVVKGEECLSFMDNGNGLNQEGMHKMLSFGYSDKVPVNGVAPIGIYGNGFKSGSMRLGKDAIVFSKSKTMSCVGMLSQTYLEKIKADQIIVPIVCFEQTDTQSVISVQEEHKASLQDILQFSPFETLEELNTELTAISSCSTEKTGTRIIIWNLRKTTAEKVEFDFESFRYDIRIPSDVYEGQADISYIPESVYSLRAYCSILYLKPRMQVIIRGQKVQTQLIAKSLASSRKDYYKPTFLLKRIPITLGYNPKSKDQYGVMMYHKNRLIKAYERVGCQLKANRLGVGVIAVIECNFLEPTHNKQSFNENDKYRKTMNNLAIKLEEYSKEICFTWNKTNQGSSTTLEDAMKRPDQNWVQCDDCLRWRKLPDGIDCSKLPDEWFCRMNPDPQFRSCQMEEEPEDSDDDQPSYCKTYKQQEKEEKRQQELKRQKEEEERKRQEAQHIAKLAKQNKTLKQILKKTVQSPSTPTTPKSRINTTLPQGRAARPVSSSLRSSTISQAACSPSSSSSLPVISSVRSLTPSSGKRPQPVTPQMTPKRPRVNSPKRTISDKLSSVDASTSSPSLPAADDDDTNDDIFILEAESTPKPSKPMFDLNKVKTEPQSSGSSLLECRDDAAMDVALEANAAGPSSSAAVGTCTTLALPPHVTNITTQTEAPKLKKEEEPQSQNGWEERPGQSTSNENSTKQSSPVGTGVCSSDIKRESETGEALSLQNRASHLDNDDAGPSSSPPHQSSIIEAQKQQDQLLELMQATAQERDSFKEQVHELTTQLHEMQKRLEELSQLNVKKECSHLAVQTEQADGGIDYKSLFEKANSKIDELVKEKEALQAAAKTRPAIGESQERDIDEIALQVDHLIRELDERTSERNKLRLQMDTLTQEKMKLMANCEKLKLILREQQQQRETAQKARATSQRTTSVQTDTAETEVASTSGADSSPKINESLIQLRQNIGRLLITYVPALDLGQVNYECNVIDEILEQVLAGVDSSEAIGQMDDPQDY